MHEILLLNLNDRQFEVAAVERIFRSEAAFHDLRFNEPGGNAIEADYREPDDWTIVGLTESLKAIFFSGTSDAALRAALIVQRRLGRPLRMVDTEYSFDLVCQGFSNVEELRTAMDNAQTG